MSQQGGMRQNQLCRCGCGFPTGQRNGYVRGHTPPRDVPAQPMTADNLEELLADLFDHGTQNAHGVVCDGPRGQFAERWGFLDASLADAQRRAAALTERHGVPFRAVTLKISVEVVR